MQPCKHGRFHLVKVGGRGHRPELPRASRARQRSLRIGIDDGRVNVTLSTNGRRVSEYTGDRFNGVTDVAFRMSVGLVVRELLERHGGEYGCEVTSQDFTAK